MIKLLLIDHQQSCQKLEQQLSLYGYAVTIATQNHEALGMANYESPDIILMSVSSSTSNIWKIIQSLKAFRQTWSIPVIALAEHDIDGRLLLEAGFDTYLRQPILTKHLLWRINALLETKSTNEISLKHPSANRPTSNVVSITKETTVCQEQIDYLGKVVYVEDSTTDSRAMAQIVQRLGFSYTNISEPLEVLPKLLEISPQYIFLDIVMPMVNGYELCGQIRRISAFKGVPITIMTGNNGIPSRLRAKFSGASGFLCKPIKEHQVRNVLFKNLYSA
jgi:CheY-like chemotaxis protein